MTHALEQDYDIKRNHKKIYRLMKENNVLAIIKAKKNYTKSGEPHPKHNVLKRILIQVVPLIKWLQI